MNVEFDGEVFTISENMMQRSMRLATMELKLPASYVARKQAKRSPHQSMALASKQWKRAQLCKSKRTLNPMLYYIPIGTVFGEYTVIGDFIIADPAPGRKSKSVRIPCRCSCGVEKNVLYYELKSGNSRHCQRCARIAGGKAYSNKNK